MWFVLLADEGLDLQLASLGESPVPLFPPGFILEWTTTLGVVKETFRLVHFEAVLLQSLKHLVNKHQMVLMWGGVDDDFVNVDDDVFYLFYFIHNLFHDSLEGSWATQKSNQHCNPLKLALPLDDEGREMDVSLVNWHLPKVRCEVNCGENGWVCPINVADAFVDFFHEILVCVGLFVETPEIVDNAKAPAGLFWNAEDEGVEGGFCLSCHPQFHPFL